MLAARQPGCPDTDAGERGRERQTYVRCGSALNTNPHFHTLIAEGVFAEQPDGSQRFVPLREPPSDVEVARLLETVRGRILRLLRRHDIDLEGGFDDGRSDPLALESPVLAQVQGASVLGRVATGPRAGQRVLHVGRDPTAPLVTPGGPRHAHIAGLDLYANVAVRAGENERLEHLCRYILRPPVAQDALELTPDGTVLLRLRRPWRDGTRALCFEPSELLEKLAVMIPRPRSNLLLYHGAFAPRGPCRGGPAVVEHALSPATAPEAGATPAAYVRPRYVAWADLLRRVFACDVLACLDCGGRLRLLATLADRAVVEKILTHLGLPVDLPQPAAARTPAWLPGVRAAADHADPAGAHWADPPPTGATPLQAPAQHGPRAATPGGGGRRWSGPVGRPFAARLPPLTGPNRPPYRRRLGAATSGPRGTVRGGSDKGCSVNNSCSTQIEMSGFSKVEMSAFSTDPRYPRGHGDSDHELRGAGSGAGHRAGDRAAADAA